MIVVQQDGGRGGAPLAPPDGRLHDSQVLPPGQDQGELPGHTFPLIILGQS